MRLLLFFSFICLSIGCTTTKILKTNSYILNGTWVPVKQEMAGTMLPKAAFENQKLIISDSLYTVYAESTDKGLVKYQDNKMDIYGKAGVNAGKHFTAIYKFENELLTVCYNLSGNGYPGTYETKNNPLYFLSVFKRN